MPGKARQPRAKNLAPAPGSGLWDDVLKLYRKFEEGFQNQQQRSNDISSYWALYNCRLGAEQLYSGRNQLFFPAIREAIQARATRFVNQLFPDSQRHVEGFTEDGTIPRDEIGMAEYYIRDLNLREFVHALCISGDVEGQYNLYVSWETKNRVMKTRIEKKGVTNEEGVEIGRVEDAVEEEEPTAGPHLELMSDADICVLPANSQSIPDALANGGGVAILRRWTDRKLKQMIRDGHVSKKVGAEILENIEAFKDDSNQTRDPSKDAVNAAGIIKLVGQKKIALIYEIWAELETEDGEYRLCQMYVASRDKVLMCRRNPLWCDLCPLISAPVEPVFGSFKGVSKCMSISPLQHFANDILNEIADSANYTMLPITFRDPAYITAPLVLAPGSVWDVPPGGVKFAEFPQLWAQGAQILAEVKAEIFQILSVNPSMITQQTKKKMNQAEVAQEQQIDLLTTSDAVRSIRDMVLNPLVNFFMQLDYQYRDKETTIREFGEFGMKAMMRLVAPFRLGKSTVFYWIGDELIRNMQQVQQKIAFINVLRQIPPQAWQRYTIDWEPALLDAAEAVLGARISRLSIKSIADVLSVPPDEENEMMAEGHQVNVHPLDNAQEHIASHTQYLRANGDPDRIFEAHILLHQKMEMMKMAQRQMAQDPQAQQQGPGARPGGVPKPGRPAQQHNGAIPADQLKLVMPRKM